MKRPRDTAPPDGGAPARTPKRMMVAVVMTWLSLSSHSATGSPPTHVVNPDHLAGLAMDALDRLPWGRGLESWLGRQTGATQEPNVDPDEAIEGSWCTHARVIPPGLELELWSYALHDSLSECTLECAAIAIGLASDTASRRLVVSGLDRRLTSRYGAGATVSLQANDLLGVPAAEVLPQRILGGESAKRWWSDSTAIVLLGEASPVRILAFTRALEHADQAIQEVTPDDYWSSSRRIRTDHLLADELGTRYPALGWLRRPDDPEASESVVRAELTATLDRASVASPADHDALLLAADGLAARWATLFPDSAVQGRELFAHDAVALHFEYSPLGSGWSYTHDLLWALWRGAATPELRDRAFTLLLERGLYSGCCCDSTDEFRAVIREGEKFLATRSPSPHDFEVEFSVASAYETWWSLGHASPGDEFVDPAAYAIGGDEARARALTHYEATIRLAPRDSYEGIIARLRIGRLRLGVDTGSRAFFCVYD